MRMIYYSTANGFSVKGSITLAWEALSTVLSSTSIPMLLSGSSGFPGARLQYGRK